MSNGKIQSEIEEIKLDSLSYKNSNTTINPTFVNFFYGNNGTGKSTLTTAIKNGSGIKKNNYNNCKTLVYNQDFIDQNIKSYENLPGVFTLDHDNIDVKEKLDELNSQKKISTDTIAAATINLQNLEAQRKDAADKILDKCWEITQPFRDAFKTGITGAGKKQSLFSHLQDYHNKASFYDMDSLKKQYAIVFTQDEEKYNLFRNIDTKETLDKLATSNILGKAIVNSSETEFAAFLKRLSATEWFRNSHLKFNNTEGKCPYCQQKLPDDFDDVIRASFDEQYDYDIRELTSIRSQYEAELTRISLTLDSRPFPMMPGLNLDRYDALVSKFKATALKNLEKISHKTIVPEEKVLLIPVTQLLEEIQEVVQTLNKAITEHNDVIDQKRRKQAEWTDSAWKLMAFNCKDSLDEYEEKNQKIEINEKDLKENVIPMNRAKVADIELQISIERKKTIETVSAMKAINTLIRNAGIQGIKLIEHRSSENSYQLVRSDGSVARNLSEGEKNFIAFLYFYHLVTGSDNADGTGADSKIVVIDDPVSSMDSNNLFLISSLTRNLVNICINAADESLLPKISEYYIKQIFILTHNVYFHKAITQGYEKYYQPVSFYIIRKENEISTVKLCEKYDPACPSDLINDNPVKNDYALLWNEVKSLKSYPSLMACMRRILEYYFIQLCGIDGISLREHLFQGENRQYFIDTNPETGKENIEKLNIAYTLVSQMESSTNIINDGMYYIDDCSDIEKCREGFKTIFKCMGQEPHYNMMMGIR